MQQDLIMILRLLLAGLCGGVIGYERESKQKPAGMRTHILVGVASALMMEISKYGFNDVLVPEVVRLDPSRVSAGVVTAIGFLGSGLIIAKNKTVSGITTSAGVWATVGVGLAVGAGMVPLGIATTVIVVGVESVLGRGGILTRTPMYPNRVSAEIRGGEAEMERLKEQIESRGFKVRRFDFTQKEPGHIKVNVIVCAPGKRNVADLLEITEDWLVGMQVHGTLTK